MFALKVVGFILAYVMFMGFVSGGLGIDLNGDAVGVVGLGATIFFAAAIE